MISISNLCNTIHDTAILKGINLEIAPGSVHALMGPNGSGKSTLAYILMGHPAYEVTDGAISFNGTDITQLSPDKRAQLGIFLAFQQPLEIPGVTVTLFLKEAYQAVTGEHISPKDFQVILSARMEQLGIDPAFAYRNLNEGFSGGEKKRLEILQLLVLKPSFVVLDEIDSGLDVDALKIIAQGIKQAQRENPQLSILIITHYQRILDHIIPDFVHIMHDGVIVQSGDASLAHTVEQKGYDAFCKV